MALDILAIGTAVPAHYLEQQDAAAVALHLTPSTDTVEQRIESLYRRTGVERRYCVLLPETPEAWTVGEDAAARGKKILEKQQLYRRKIDDQDRGPSTAERMSTYAEHAGKLAHEAALAALSQSGSASQIRHLITVSCTGFRAPGFDIELVRSLSLPPSVTRTHIGFMGCHGALNGLRVANALSATEPDHQVLLCCVELCSLHQQYTGRTDQIIANALFSDGAAALVGQWSPGGKGDGLRLTASQSLLLAGSSDFMRWEIEDHGFAMSLSPRIPHLFRKTVGPWLAQWLAQFNLRIEDIQGWCIHPGGPKIVAAVGEALQLTSSQLAPTYEILARYGNMSSPTVLFILDSLQKQAVQPPFVLLAFGPGLAVEAALMQ